MRKMGDAPESGGLRSSSAAKVPGSARTDRKNPRGRGRQDRGAGTRARLLDAALDVFGHKGFEGATTREIAQQAGVNLAAILYHFGSKDALYLAVAEHIVAEIGARAGGIIGTAEAMVPGLDADAARMLLFRLIDTFVDVILGSAAAERWARFIIREQLDPTPAFETLYGFMGPAHALATRLVAAASGSHPDALDTKLRAFAILGQGLIFRIGQNLVLRRIDKSALGPEERARIKAVLHANVAAIIGSGDRQ